MRAAIHGAWISRLGGRDTWWAAADPYPRASTGERVGEIVATAQTDPPTLGLPIQPWAVNRLPDYSSEQKGSAVK